MTPNPPPTIQLVKVLHVLQISSNVASVLSLHPGECYSVAGATSSQVRKKKIFAQGIFSTAKTGSPYFWQLQCLKPFFWQPGQGEERVKRVVLESTLGLVWLVLIKIQVHLLSHFTNQSWNRSQTFANTKFILCNSCNRKVKL